MAVDCLEASSAVPLAHGCALVDRIVQELGPDLVRVARRARALGPATEGTIILLTGCRRGVGCTTVALALAQAAAADQAVLLIDGDQAQPGLAIALGFAPSWGWDDALGESDSFDEAFHSIDAAPQLTLLPRRRSPADSAKLLADPAFGAAHSRLRQAFGLVVLDGGSVWDGGAAWAPWADVALVVCDSGNKLADDWARAWDRLEAGGTRVLGIIETLG